jgi:hypothetical protein
VRKFQDDNERQFDHTKDLWGPRLAAIQFAGYGLAALGVGVGTGFYLAGRGTPAPAGTAGQLGVIWSGRF